MIISFMICNILLSESQSKYLIILGFFLTFLLGTAIRESVEILAAAEGQLVAVAVSLDRQEKATDASVESAIQVI